MDFPSASAAPTRALDHDQSSHFNGGFDLRCSMADGRDDLAALPELNDGVEYDVMVLGTSIPLKPV
jgi:hypothetical protein